MPTSGEIQRAKDVGVGLTSHRVQWLACEGCGVLRWVWLRKGQPQSRWCYACGRTAGKPRGSKPREQHPNWKGGRHRTTAGYIQVVIALDDPMLCMADERGRVFEHRLVMARALGRPLLTSEEVHHRNGRKHDNNIENLVLMSKSEHASEPFLEIQRLRQRVVELEHELATIKAETP